MNTKTSIMTIAITSMIAIQTTTPLRAMTKTVGNSMFGASITTAFDRKGYVFKNPTPDNGISGAFEGLLTSRIDGNILSKSMKLASSTAGVALNGATNEWGAWVDLKALGKTLFDWKKGGAHSDDFKTPPIVLAEVGHSETFLVGPVPIVVEAGASIRIWVDGKVVESVGKGRPADNQPLIQLTLRPLEADVAAFASGDVGVKWASAGVKGTLTLVRSGIGGSFALVPKEDSAFVNYSSRLEICGPNRAIELFAKVGLGWFKKKFGATIFNWKSISIAYPFIEPQSVKL